MTVTEVKRQKGHLVSVTFSCGETMLFDSDYALQNGLREEAEFTKEQINKMFCDSEYLRAKNRALWFLDRAPRSERELYEKTANGKIDPDAVRRAIARLKEVGLVDDKKYAEALAEKYLSACYSKREVYAKLITRKLPSSVVKAALDVFEVDESEQVAAIIGKKYKGKINTDADVKKTVAALIRRGFSYQSVRSALKNYKKEIEYGEF